MTYEYVIFAPVKPTTENKLTLFAPAEMMLKWFENTTQDIAELKMFPIVLQTEVNDPKNVCSKFGSISDMAKGSDSNGIFYRIPVATTTVVSVCNTGECNPLDFKKVLTLSNPSPAHGHLALLEFEVKAFEDKALTIDFHSTGVPKKVVFENKKSSLESGVNALNDALETYKEEKASLVTQEFDNKKEALQAQYDYEKLKKEYEEFKAENDE